MVNLIFLEFVFNALDSEGEQPIYGVLTFPSKLSDMVYIKTAVGSFQAEKPNPGLVIVKIFCEKLRLICQGKVTQKVFGDFLTRKKIDQEESYRKLQMDASVRQRSCI